MKLSEKAQASLNKVIAAFEQGDLSPIVEVVKIRRHPNDQVPAHKWSMANQIMAFIQSGGILDCRGFRQWEEAGRKVSKGATAVYILAPNTMSIEDKKTGEDKRIITGFHTIPVFAVNMTEGDPLPTFDYAPLELPPLYDVAASLGVSVDYGPIESGARGWYSPGQKHIRLGVHEPKTFFHELAHAAHDKIEGVKGGQDVQQETIAEFTAAVLSDLYGYERTGNAWNYISGYAEDPLTAIYKAMSTIEKVLALILDQVPASSEPQAALPEPVVSLAA